LANRYIHPVGTKFWKEMNERILSHEFDRAKFSKGTIGAKGLKVGFANSLVIPQRNLFGKIVGIKCRKLEAEADDPKNMNRFRSIG